MADLSRGANAPLTGERFELAVAGAREGSVDLMVFQLGANRKVRDDADFVFFNQPASPEGGVRLNGPDRVSVDLALVPQQVEVLAVAVALDDAVSGSLAGISGLGVLVTGSGTPRETHSAPAAGLTTERAAVLVEIYRLAGAWKLRNVSAGWAAGLPALAREHGVAIDPPDLSAAPALELRQTARNPLPPAVVAPARPARAAAVPPPPPIPAPGGWVPPGGSLPPPVFSGPVPRPGGWAPPRS